MPQVGFKPITLVFEGTKAVHALDRAATEIKKSGNRKIDKEISDLIYFENLISEIKDMNVKLRRYSKITDNIKINVAYRCQMIQNYAYITFSYGSEI
jgi:hypothetical protein